MREEQAAKQLGRNLWLARRRAGYSQEELAAICSLHRTEIGQLENGRRFPRVDTLIKLATALEVGPDQLLRGVDWIPPAPASAGGFAVQGVNGGGRAR
ncbi:MAG TPA: helix-turn-helix transcriptional regulator [Solirubrobacterales bacterium]|nr:helix-turn-helix transcriptional regulator [Solirubrobacterales bacterium]